MAAGLGPVPDLDVSTDDRLLSSVDRMPLAARADAVPAYAGKGNAAVRKLLTKLAPEARSIRAPAAVITNLAEADKYLASLREAIEAELAAGHPVNMS
jgi:hypothetical protein